jgi:hypothetical protein
MLKTHSESQATTVIPILRNDGTVYFRYAGKTISQRLGDWMLAFLWFLVLAVIVTIPLWS